MPEYIIEHIRISHFESYLITIPRLNMHIIQQGNDKQQRTSYFVFCVAAGIKLK